MRIAAFVTILGLLAGTAAPLRAQSLADVAKKEEERRKKVQDSGSGKVYTNGDLQSVPAPPSPPPSTLSAPLSPDVAAPGDKKPEAKPDEKTAKDEKSPAKGETKDRDYWNGRMRALSEQLDRDRLYAEALQSRINALTAEFSARDDPARRALIGLDRDKALAELDRLKKVIEEDQDAIDAFEEEARRASVPPGWLRD